MYGDLFSVNIEAHTLPSNEVKSKLRTLYAGKKKDSLIARIASTFDALCEYADFSADTATAEVHESASDKEALDNADEEKPPSTPPRKPLSTSLQYHINIVLPESRDQAVYDAIFKSLRDHLG